MSQRKKIFRKIRFHLIILTFFTGVMFASIFVMHSILLRNSKEMGSLLIQNYCTDEENQISRYEAVLTLATRYVDKKKEKGATLVEIKEGLYPYLDVLSELFRGSAIEVYGIIDGQVVSNNPVLENYPGYDYEQTQWYQKAQKANGKIIYTDTYLDTRTGTPNITVSKKADGSDSVISMDLFLEDYHDRSGSLNLPEDASYYLCDKNGTLLYYDTPDDKPYEEYQGFIDQYWEDIQKRPEMFEKKSIKDIDGSRRNLYQCQMSNGWTAMLTISQEKVLANMDIYQWIVIGLSVAGIGLVILMAVRDFRHEKGRRQMQEERREIENKTRLYQRAIESMAVTYKEIYDIDLENDEYRLIYPSMATSQESGNYSRAIAEHFLAGRIQGENSGEVEQFLSRENIKKNLAQNEYMELKYKRCMGDEGPEWCLTSIMAAERENGEVTSVTMAIRSIEDMVRQEEEKRELLDLALQRAKTASNAKTELLSRMSHDIRTPLNAILGLTTVADMHMDEQERIQDILGKIKVSGKHLLGLINEMLDLSKIESGKAYLSEGPFAVDDILDSMLVMFHEAMQQKHISFRIERKIQHHELVGDVGKISRIFINILGNAVKYTPQGGSVLLTAKEEEQHGRSTFCFTFADTGMGMSKEFLEKIFDPFEREVDTHGEKIEGTGLGMPIAVNLAKLMGGDIQVESELGKGSTFVVRLPLKISETGEEIVKKADYDAAVTQEKPDYSGRRVLLVEDNAINLEVAKELLWYTGLEVDVAYNGMDAFERVMEQEPYYYDLILMDIRMPKMNGYDAATAIRQSGREDLADVPIIAMTADAFEEDIRKCEQAGMNGHIAKPVDRKILYGVLAHWLNR